MNRWRGYAWVITLLLTERQLEDLTEALEDPAIDHRFKQKLLALRMHHEGAAHGFIGRCLNISQPTLRTYLVEYQDGGLARLLEDRSYRPSSSLAPFWQCLKCSFAVAPVPNAKAAVERMERLTGVRLSESQSRRAMKRMGLSLKKVAPLPGKMDAQLQLNFYEQEMTPRLAQAAKGERKVFFVDAAHFVLGAFLGLLWCFARPFIKTSPGRQRYSVLGAVDSHTKEIISYRTTENINAHSVCELLALIRAKHPVIAITLIMDNARYQRCESVRSQATLLDIELLYLPAYSPNLNLIERLWKLVKKRCLTNRYYPTFADFRHAIDQCLENVTSTASDELRSLLSLNFQFFSLPK
jgi:transposase